MWAIGVLGEGYFWGAVGQKLDCVGIKNGTQCIEATLTRFLVIKEKSKAGEEWGIEEGWIFK